MSKSITFVNYDIGNILNVERALNFLDCDLKIAETPDDILKAEKLVVPGVGAFSSCISELEKRDFKDAIIETAKKGTPLLGICVGMQMLFESSEEFGQHDGFGLIEGKVVAIPKVSPNGVSHKIPHISWAELKFNQPDNPLLKGIKEDSAVYFVHSFMAQPENVENRIADIEFGGYNVCALTAKDNIFGTQFHPEKSGKIGLAILNNFIIL